MAGDVTSASRLFILVPEEASIEALRVRLDRLAPNDIRERISVIRYDRRASVLRDTDGEPSFWRSVRARDAILLATSVPRLREAAETGASVRRADFAEITKGQALELTLRQLELSRAARVEKLIDQYSRGTSAASIDEWIRQFEEIGAKHLGEALAESIEVVKTRQVCETLFPSEQREVLWREIESGDTAICILPRLSSSGSTIASHASDWLPQIGKINKTFGQQLGDDASPKRIIAIDDGIWSGFDAIGTFEDVLGMARTNTQRQQKSDGSVARSRFDLFEIEIRVALRCDLGVLALQGFFGTHSISNVRVSEQHGKVVPVISGSREIDFRNVLACELEGGRIAPLFHSCPAIQNLKDSDLALLEDVCTELTRVNNPKKSPEWLRANRYGTNNIGSLITFTHSCPKATLPCFRSGGDLHLSTSGRKKSITWKPLFSARLSAARQDADPPSGKEFTCG